MYVTTKSTLYLIDGLNLVRSFLYEFARSEEEVTADFLDFLTDISQDEHYCMHQYEVIFDGSFRPVGPLYRAGVHISFSEEEINMIIPVLKKYASEDEIVKMDQIIKMFKQRNK